MTDAADHPPADTHDGDDGAEGEERGHAGRDHLDAGGDLGGTADLLVLRVLLDRLRGGRVGGTVGLGAAHVSLLLIVLRIHQKVEPTHVMCGKTVRQ